MQTPPKAEPYGRSGSILKANPTERGIAIKYGLGTGTSPGQSGGGLRLRTPANIRKKPPAVYVP